MYPTWTSSQLPTWERDGVVLIGDAAHALPSTSGQGSSQVLEDAEAFALFLLHYLCKAYNDSLSSTQTANAKQAIKTAAKHYMDLRQPHVKAILENTQKIQNNKRSMGVIEEYFMYLFMWVWVSQHHQRIMHKEGRFIADDMSSLFPGRILPQCLRRASESRESVQCSRTCEACSYCRE